MNRFRNAHRAFSTARSFGRSAGVALWLAARMLLTGATGKYRIKC
jgi:hypothetical protein